MKLLKFSVILLVLSFLGCTSNYDLKTVLSNGNDAHGISTSNSFVVGHSISNTNDFYFDILKGNEREWMLKLSDKLNGKTEVVIKMGRIDIETTKEVIEVDFFHKWHESIGQALHYGYETKKQPVIALIVDDTFSDDKLIYIKDLCKIYKIRVMLLRKK